MSEVTTFSNEKLRPSADAMAKLYNLATLVIDEWDARPEVQPTNDSTPIDDGSGDTGDGRPQLTGAKMHNTITRLTEIRDLIDGSAVGAIAGRHDTILQMAVNTKP